MDETNEVPPRKVVLFSGHMVDATGREEPRFPPDKEPVAAHWIAAALGELAIEARDLCICGGACGGDLLFAEAALCRSARLELYIPFDESTFQEKSVDFAGNSWRDRFFAAKARAALHVQPIELGPPPASEDPYANATTAGCWRRLRASARRGSTFSASGMERAVTARVARAT